jgi:cardiolipin synthase
MVRPNALASPARLAATVIVGAAVALAGCKVQIPAGGSASAPAPATSAAAAPAPAASAPAGSAAPRSVALLTEPGAGFSPVYGLINGARHSIDLTMYELADPTAEADLAADAQRGVNVRVILDQKEQATNSGAQQYLSSHRVKVVWSSPAYEYTHQKTLEIDGTEAVIMTANLTSQYYPTSRDFLVTDYDPADVTAITNVFNADFAHQAVQPSDGDDLVWSPTGAQQQLLGLINGATSSLRIYSEEMGDTTVDNALISAAKRRVDVQICGENTDGEYSSDYTRLAQGGVRISYYDSPDGFYIHGKVIEADYGTSHAKVSIESQNFSSTSLNHNRELGLITSNRAVLSSIASTFAGDFRNGQQWP